MYANSLCMFSFHLFRRRLCAFLNCCFLSSKKIFFFNYKVKGKEIKIPSKVTNFLLQRGESRYKSINSLGSYIYELIYICERETCGNQAMKISFLNVIIFSKTVLPFMFALFFRIYFSFWNLLFVCFFITSLVKFILSHLALVSKCI